REAKYVVEARAMVGTNRNEVLLGIPSMSLPNIGMPGVPSAIPEIAFAKSSAQKGVAKIGVFAYNRETGLRVWQSGSLPVASNAQNPWVLGVGPLQRGSIYSGNTFAGNRIQLPFRTERLEEHPSPSDLTVTQSCVFHEPEPTAPMPPASSIAATPATA